MVRSRSYIATPPGATIREQLNDRGLTQKEFAVRMDMSEKHISKLINGDVQLTPEQQSDRDGFRRAGESFGITLRQFTERRLLRQKRKMQWTPILSWQSNCPFARW